MSAARPGTRLGLDVVATRGVGRLRLVGALVVFPSSLIFGMGGEPLHYTLAGLGVLVSIGWTAAWARSRRAIAGAGERFLDLSGDALSVVEGEQRTEVPWSSVVTIDVDEERLVVVVERQTEAPLRIEPVWGGLGVYELRDRLQATASGARRADDG